MDRRTLPLVVLTLLAACRPSTPRSLTVNTQTPEAVATPARPIAPCINTQTRFFPEAIAWLKQAMVPLNPSATTLSATEVQAVKALVGSARIVALGESTHGTHEFQALRIPLVGSLVEDMGFTTVALEAPWVETQPIDDYLQTADGDPDVLLHQIPYWIYQTQETLDLIKWIAKYNGSVPPSKRVHLSGFDLPYPDARTAITYVKGYLERVDPQAAERAGVSFACLANRNSSDYYKLSAGDRASCRAGLEEAQREIAATAAEYVQKSSAQALANASHAMQQILFAEAAYSSVVPYESEGVKYMMTNPEARDPLMARNVEWLLSETGENGRVLLIGHNAHIGDNYYTLFQGHGTMGALLRDEYGSSYVTIQFYFGEGSFNASPLGTPHKAGTPVPDSYEAFFQTANMPAFLLDLRKARPGTPATGWLRGPHCNRNISSMYDDAFPQGGWGITSLPDETDAVVFVTQTTPTKLLFSVATPEP